MIVEQLAASYFEASPWREAKWSDSQRENIFLERAKDALLLSLEFTGTEARLTGGELETHLYSPSLKNFFQIVQEFFPIRGKILVSLLDGAPGDISSHVPLLSFTKMNSDAHSLLIPDPYFLDNVGYAENFASIDRDLLEIRRDQRLAVAYWRGASTGLPTLGLGTWKANPRVRLCMQAMQMPELLDARISRVVQVEDQSIVNEAEFKSILTEWEPLSRNLLYRFGIDIDGNSCAWGLLQKMYMDLSIVKVRSRWMQWYYPLLEDGKHLLYVDSELVGLKDALLRLRADAAFADNIAANARSLVRELNYAQAAVYTGTLLSKLFERQ